MAYQSFKHDENYRWDLRDAGTFVPDIAYDDLSETNRLDLYLPSAGEMPYPVVVYVHGGGYVQGDKSHHLSPLLQVLSCGYALACVNYRLSDEAPFPAAMRDIIVATAFLKEHAAQWNLDPERVLLWGETHGGYLVDRIAIDEPKGSLGFLPEGWCPLGLSGVVSMYAPIDLAGYYRSKMEDERLGLTVAHFQAICQVFGQTDETLYDYLVAENPLARIDGSECPFYLIHGELDDEIPHYNTYELDKALTAAGVDHEMDIVEGGHHGLDYYDNERAVKPILGFIDRVFAH